MKKILVPIDGSLNSKAAMEKAKELAKAFNSGIILLNIVPIYPSAFPYSISEGLQRDLLLEARAAGKKILEDAKAVYSDMENRVETVLLEGTPAEEIIAYAHDRDVDLVVMSSKGMGGLQNIMIGSVTRKVAIQVDKPMLIVK
jgi:nucleotide-binding universal stress UspA family protein